MILEEKRVLVKRVCRLAKLIWFGAPDELLCRSFALVEKSMRESMGNDNLSKARFRVNNDPSWRDPNIKGEG